MGGQPSCLKKESENTKRRCSRCPPLRTLGVPQCSTMSCWIFLDLPLSMAPLAPSLSKKQTRCFLLSNPFHWLMAARTPKASNSVMICSSSARANCLHSSFPSIRENHSTTSPRSFTKMAPIPPVKEADSKCASVKMKKVVLDVASTTRGLPV